jgi:hypothetical protein
MNNLKNLPNEKEQLLKKALLWEVPNSLKAMKLMVSVF